MSKKSRLRALKAKQLEQKKRLELEEQELEKQAQSKSVSKAAKKYRKSANVKEPVIYKIIKAIMLFPYLINGLFFGTVTILAILVIGLHGISNSMAYVIAASLLIMTAGLVFTFMRKYILALVLCASGSGMFLGVGVKFVSKIRYYMENYYVDEANKNMDIKYMLYFYPIAIFTVCSAALLIITIIRAVHRRRKEKERYNNQPVKSIVD